MRFWGIIIIIIIVVGVLGWRLMTPEDNWVCVSGKWVAHGHPSSPAPILGCAAENISNSISTTSVKVYFGNSQFDPQVLKCEEVYPVEREVLASTDQVRLALETLLSGPTEIEKNKGFFTTINPGVIIRDLQVSADQIRVDFSEDLERAVGGSCRVSAIRAQITETLKQFLDNGQVVISVSGRTEDILQP